MTERFPSEGWIEAFGAELNANEAWVDAAGEWGVDFNGDTVFVVEADGELDRTRYFFVGLEAGQCTDAYEIAGLDDAEHGFAFKGPYANWKRLIRGEIGAIRGLMTGQFSLDGSMRTVLGAREAVQLLVGTVTRMDTEFEQ